MSRHLLASRVFGCLLALLCLCSVTNPAAAAGISVYFSESSGSSGTQLESIDVLVDGAMYDTFMERPGGTLSFNNQTFFGEETLYWEEFYVECVFEDIPLLLVPPGIYRLVAPIFDEDLYSNEIHAEYDVTTEITVLAPTLPQLVQIVRRMAALEGAVLSPKQVRPLARWLRKAEAARKAGKRRLARRALKEFSARVQKQQGRGIRADAARVLLLDAAAVKL